MSPRNKTAMEKTVECEESWDSPLVSGTCLLKAELDRGASLRKHHISVDDAYCAFMGSLQPNLHRVRSGLSCFLPGGQGCVVCHCFQTSASLSAWAATSVGVDQISQASAPLQNIGEGWHWGFRQDRS